jgi:hypothetical protein
MSNAAGLLRYLNEMSYTSAQQQGQHKALKDSFTSFQNGGVPALQPNCLNQVPLFLEYSN